MAQDPPPPEVEINTVELVSVESSKITSVSLYSGRAEITRLYTLNLATGQNQVKISGLPNVLDHSSLRVEGRGSATIHGVTIASTPIPPVASTSDKLVELQRKKARLEKALVRCQKSIVSLESFVGSVKTESIDVDKLGSIVQKYEVEGEKLDDRLLELEQLLKDVDSDIVVEKARLQGSNHQNNQLGQTATISVFADHGGDVELALIYAVTGANWSAAYDIRVDMQTMEKPVTLIYKAAIRQNTGETWEDVPLTLETVTPTFGMSLPALQPWRLSVWKPALPPSTRASGTGVMFKAMAKKRKAAVRAELEEESEDDLGFGIFDDDALMPQMQLGISGQGAMSATYQVPGLITIPSDGQEHNVTIAQLQLDATMSWVTVPRIETRVHLKAKVKNASDYTLLRGKASVYVDGSFISKSDVPAVSPKESFDCPLGLDPSIRVAYHPVEKKASNSGFYTKTTTHVFTQRITVHNTRSSAIKNLKVVDHVPVSEDAQLNVKLVTPALTLPSSTATSGGKSSSLNISDGIIAQWDGTEEAGADVHSLGKDGKLNWLCSVPAQGKVNLQLQWEVSSPSTVTISGL